MSVTSGKWQYGSDGVKALRIIGGQLGGGAELKEMGSGHVIDLFPTDRRLLG